MGLFKSDPEVTRCLKRNKLYDISSCCLKHELLLKALTATFAECQIKEFSPFNVNFGKSDSIIFVRLTCSIRQFIHTDSRTVHDAYVTKAIPRISYIHI